MQTRSRTAKPEPPSGEKAELSTQPQHAHVLVAGTGPAGMIAALALSRAGFKVTLAGPDVSVGDGRTTALMNPALAMLDRLGVLEKVKPQAAPLKVMRIVDATRRLVRSPTVTFRASEIGEERFGLNMPNAVLNKVLGEAVAAEPGIEWRRSLVAEWNLGGERAAATLADGSEVCAALAVAADGRLSPARRAAGIDVSSHAYPQAALVLNFSHRSEHGFVSTEFHTETGPCTQVPLPGNRSSLVWVVRPETAAELAALDDATLSLRIEERMQSMLGRVSVDSGRQIYPLSTSTPRRFAARRLALGGEAAARGKPAGKPFTDLLRGRIGKVAAWSEAEARILEGACFHPGLEASEVSAVASRLVEAGAEERVLRALESTPPSPHVAELCTTMGSWSSEDALRKARTLVATGTLEGEVRFRLAKALTARGDAIPVETFLRAIREPSEGSEAGWLDPADLLFLQRSGLDRRQIAAAMLRSPDAEHRGRAVAALLGSRSVAAEPLDLLRRFVENADAVSDARAARAASRRLLANGDGTGIPFLLGEVRRGYGSRSRVSPVRLLRQAAADGEARSLGAAIGANGAGSPFLELFRGGAASGVDAKTRNAVLLELLRDIESGGPRDTRADDLLRLMSFEPDRNPTVERLVSCFTWGVRQARRLTGREISVHLATGGALGCTVPGDSRVFVSPMPILRPEHDDATPSTALDPEGEPYGDVLVKALILHEIGHHMYGADEASRAAAAEAARLGIGAVLNLVEDVYLERSMRREEPAFGRAFDLLTAWAFLRAKCDIPVEVLFEQLGERAMAVLSKVALGRARELSSVRLVGGQLLQELERAGSSWARFVRALRLGKGDRHDDAKVREGLGLFEKSAFRRSTPEDRLRIAKRLAGLFASDATGLSGAWGPPFGPPPATELKVAAGSISEAAIQEGVPRRLGADAGRGKGSRGHEAPELARLWRNLDPEERFEKISRVESVTRSAEREQAAARVARPFSRRLRLEMEELDLGNRLEPRTHRVRGRLGRVGLSAALVRRDPRLLVARERRPARDLFLGLLVDCSWSMRYEGSIEKARLFAALFCEAARGLPGIETRILGFDDRLHDAGTADRSAAQSLVPGGGGTNEAGALWNLGLRALESGRTAKAIVEVSDGLPTLCSVAAVRAVVRALEARGVACVQVAVRPLEATSFRDHVLLETPDPAEAARRFAGVLSRVIRRALAG